MLVHGLVSITALYWSMAYWKLGRASRRVHEWVKLHLHNYSISPTSATAAATAGPLSWRGWGSLDCMIELISHSQGFLICAQ